MISRYIIAALVGLLVVSGFAIVTYRSLAKVAETERAVAQSALEAAQAVNAANARNVARMLEQAEADNALIADLTEAQRDIADAVTDAAERIKALETTDAEVADYLARALPGGLLPEINRAARPNANGLRGAAQGAPGAAP